MITIIQKLKIAKYVQNNFRTLNSNQQNNIIEVVSSKFNDLSPNFIDAFENTGDGRNGYRFILRFPGIVKTKIPGLGEVYEYDCVDIFNPNFIIKLNSIGYNDLVKSFGLTYLTGNERIVQAFCMYKIYDGNLEFNQLGAYANPVQVVPDPVGGGSIPVVTQTPIKTNDKTNENKNITPVIVIAGVLAYLFFIK